MNFKSLVIKLKWCSYYEIAKKIQNSQSNLEDLIAMLKVLLLMKPMS